MSGYKLVAVSRCKLLKPKAEANLALKGMGKKRTVTSKNYVRTIIKRDCSELEADNVFRHLNDRFKEHQEWREYLNRLKSTLEETFFPFELQQAN